VREAGLAVTPNEYRFLDFRGDPVCP
jgi:hypothetical protein